MTPILPDSIALVGTPNVGKSVLFGFLTGHYVNVSNYPGTTIEIVAGRLEESGRRSSLYDTPGVYTLIPMSEEERVLRDMLLTGRVRRVAVVGDAKNPARALFLALQIGEMGIPHLLALNMEDEAVGAGVTIDKTELAAELGIPVVGTIAIQKKGLREIRQALQQLRNPVPFFRYSEEIETAITAMEPLLPIAGISKRSLALMLLAGDRTLADWLRERCAPEVLKRLDDIVEGLKGHFNKPMAYLIEKQRLRQVETLIGLFVKERRDFGKALLTRLGRISMHSVWGVPILAGVLFLLYEFVGKFGAQTAVGWLENGLFGRYLNPWAVTLVSEAFSFSPFIRDLLVGPYGIITMALTYAFAIIFPIVLTFFLFFSLLEDSGYLPRLAVLLNRLFRLIGLNGKAVIPLVLGLGCDTMATLSARIVETKKERVILTLLLALGVPCSAQLGIILGMLAQLPAWATWLWGGVIALVLLVVGRLAAKLLPGDRMPFLVEIPPLRRPTLFNIAAKTVARLEWYLKEVVPLFVIGTLILFTLDKAALLPRLQQFANPLVVRLLDLPPQATEAFLIGFLRRDYAATHFFDLFANGELDPIQSAVSLIVITLFVPCLANLLMIIKERGWKTAVAMVAFIYPVAFAVGGAVNGLLRVSW